MIDKNTTSNYNPKSHTPSVYIPNWLIQVPIDLISTSAKMLYGRLSQWSNTKGEVFRSAPELAHELGMKPRTIEKFLKELRDIKLIETFQPQAGGKNHFRFKDHPWIHEPINKYLSYDSFVTPPPYVTAPPAQPCHTPRTTMRHPPAQPCGTPPHNHADINIKEIKTNNTTTSSITIFEHTQGQPLEGQPQDQTSEKFERECLSCPECLEIFEERFSNCDITLKQLYDDCSDYWRQSNQLVYKSRFLSHLTKCPTERFVKKHVNSAATSAPYPEGCATEVEDRARLQEEFSKKRYEEEQEQWKKREPLPPRTKTAIDLKPMGYAPRRLSNFLPLTLDHKTNN